MEGKVIAVCISEKKGTEKVNIHSCEVIEGFGLKNDAHGGNWHRQVSLLSHEKIEDFKTRGGFVEGSFWREYNCFRNRFKKSTSWNKA